MTKTFNIKITPEGLDMVDDEETTIASQNPSLKLPLLPQIEENVEELAKKAISEKTAMIPVPTRYWIENINRYETLWAEGYKAASSKRFSEEDMRKCWQAATTKADAWFDTDTYEKVQDVEQYLQSLSPKQPIKVSVFVENGIPLQEGDYIKVDRYIYE